MKNLFVIVIDDNLVSRLLPGFILHSYFKDVQVIESESGPDALRLLEIHKVSHVLIDISMPQMDGFRVAKRIKENPHFSNIRLIAYTADVLISELPNLKSIGFDDILLKPLNASELLRALDIMID